LSSEEYQEKDMSKRNTNRAVHGVGGFGGQAIPVVQTVHSTMRNKNTSQQPSSNAASNSGFYYVRRSIGNNRTPQTFEKNAVPISDIVRKDILVQWRNRVAQTSRVQISELNSMERLRSPTAL